MNIDFVPGLYYADVWDIFLVVFMAVAAIVLTVRLVFWILGSFARFSMARRRNLDHSWLAWIPVGRDWILGSLSDQYQYLVKGRWRSLRKWLVVTGVLAVVCRSTCAGLSIASVLLEIFRVEQNGYYLTLVIPTLVSVTLGLVSGLSSVVYYVLHKVALFDVYRSCDPDSAVLFLVLSIFVPVTEPFLLVYLRKKELGMPPRKTTA